MVLNSPLCEQPISRRFSQIETARDVRVSTPTEYEFAHAILPFHLVALSVWVCVCVWVRPRRSGAQSKMGFVSVLWLLIKWQWLVFVSDGWVCGVWCCWCTESYFLITEILQMCDVQHMRCLHVTSATARCPVLYLLAHALWPIFRFNFHNTLGVMCRWHECVCVCMFRKLCHRLFAAVLRSHCHSLGQTIKDINECECVCVSRQAF